jgi:molybdate transport system regulatory protein
MNKLPGIVTHVDTSVGVSLADIDVAGDTLSALVIASDSHASFLIDNTPVLVLFAETEVSLAKNLSGLISLRNRLASRVKTLDRGAVLTRAVLDYRGHDVVAVITTRSAERLSLAPGDEVECLIKANEVTLVPREAA